MKKIKTEKEYEAIMSRIDEIIAIIDDNTPKTDKNMIELDFLTDLVVAFEKEHYKIEKPSLQEVIKLRMHEMGLTQKEASVIIGVSPSRLSEYLTGKSEPTLSVARSISKKLKIDASIVLGV